MSFVFILSHSIVLVQLVFLFYNAAKITLRDIFSMFRTVFFNKESEITPSASHETSVSCAACEDDLGVPLFPARSLEAWNTNPHLFHWGKDT